MQPELLTYKILLERLFELQSDKFVIHFKSDYFIIQFPKHKYHVTIYQGQWDSYYVETGLPYNLFHITSETDSKCSTYFWVNSKKQINPIPKKFFVYEQPTYSLKASTRPKCQTKKLIPILWSFQKILNQI